MSRERDFYFKFQPEKWRSDEQLGSCSLAARGLWIELLALAHKHDGYVLVNGVPPMIEPLAQLVRSNAKEVAKLLDELKLSGVCSVDERGAISSRRMVRDAQKRSRNKANGALGGNPVLSKVDNQSDNQNALSVDIHNPNIGSDLSLSVSSPSALDLELQEEDDSPVSSVEPRWGNGPRRADPSNRDLDYHRRNCPVEPFPWAKAACEAGVCIPKYLWMKWAKRKSAEELRVFVELWTPRFAGDREEDFWPRAFASHFGTSELSAQPGKTGSILAAARRVVEKQIANQKAVGNGE
jgi:hypothetical protein